MLPNWLVWLLALPVGAASLSQPNRRLAVADFDYSAVMDQVQAVFGSQMNIGRGINALLVNRLTAGQRYTVVERNKLDSVLKEQDFGADGRVRQGTGARIGRIHGADAILMGDIVVFGRDDKKKRVKVGGLVTRFYRVPGIGGLELGRTEEKAVVVINYRLVDAETSEVLHTAEARGESLRRSKGWGGLLAIGGVGGGAGVDMTNSNFAETIIGEATIDAVSKLAEALNGQAYRLPAMKVDASGRVADVSGATLTLTVGRKDGVAVNDRFAIERIQREIRHPATQEVLDVVSEKLGELLVTEVRENITIGAYAGRSVARVGDLAVRN